MFGVTTYKWIFYLEFVLDNLKSSLFREKTFIQIECRGGIFSSISERLNKYYKILI